MDTFRVSINPRVLRWSRESMNLPLDSAARKIGVLPETLSAWEAGEASPTFHQLRDLADKYGFPLATFYLDELPDESPTIVEFRGATAAAHIRLPYEVLRELVRVNSQQDVMSELADIEQVQVPQLDVVISTSMTTSEAGAKLRTWLGLELEQQKEWANQDRLFGRTRALVESKGILVTQVQGRHLAPLRGCALSHHDFPAIIVSSTDSQSGKLFTLVHELSHVLIRKSGELDVTPITANRRIGKTDLERFCNSVAASALLPGDDVRQQAVVSSHKPSSPWGLRELRDGARVYGVSPQAFLIRLIELGYTDWGNYSKLRPGFNEMPQASKSGGGDGNRNKVYSLGKLYVRSVAAAYRSGRLELLPVLRYLSTSVESLPKVLAIADA